MKKIKKTITVTTIAISLAACGGGGGSDSSSPSSPPVAVVPAPPTTPVVTPGDLQTSVPALTYAANSPEFAFVTELNQFRQQVGLGLLAQNAMLDKSAQNHLQYVLTNDVLKGGTVDMRTFDPVTGRPMFHIEAASNPNFTGVQEWDRAKSAGYSSAYVGEELAFGGGKGGQAALSTLTKTIYHRAGLMVQGDREVGIAVGQDSSQTFTLELGYVTPQSNASDFLGVYPAANQTGVGRYTGVETPNPFPDLSTSTDDFPTKTGYPVSVATKEGTTLEVITFTITEAGATAPLDARLMTKDNDPNRYLTSNIAFLVAQGTLKAKTTFSVKFSGRVNNVVVNKNWQFTTGA
ncbi:CAP domain-containing protein [Janthinobacterium agaricidamnosum]|uniref:CAP domain-containing protein n=1 Tax=Janthinobacterium agaricidamnosum TaxID=55508 RepID=UPI000AC09DB4|nr:CAP domain-containing protein [Janthinobacterium agaricidamnosum]